MRVYRQKDLRGGGLSDKTVAVLGYGNQGHAHALNLRDSGVKVAVGARPKGEGWKRAVHDGFEPVSPDQAVRGAECVAVLLPDETHEQVFREVISPHLEAGASVLFAHGFSVAFGAIELPAAHDVLLVAPKGQGHYLREQYMRKQGLPCLLAIERDVTGDALNTAIAYADALGCLRAGAVETTFREEAVTDLFGEQAVLCGGVPALVTAAFETLVERGYRPEIAYLECLHELKIITDLMHRRGIAGMRQKISRTAAWGSLRAAEHVRSDHTRSVLAALLDAIESGEFASTWRAEANAGAPHLTEMTRREASHPIEQAGRTIREMMPYLEEDVS
jgi:ketol-acid reductoisomerase